MKKSLLWMLVLVISISMILTFSVSGCKATKEEAAPTEAAAEEVEEEEAEEAPAEEAAPEEKVELMFWDMVWGPPEYVETAERLVEEFNEENSSITVTYQSIPWEGFYETFTTAVASGTAPDVSTGAGYQPFQFAVMDEILYLDSITDEWKAEGKLEELFFPGSVDSLKYDGKQVGIPWLTGNWGIFYRKDMLEKAGVEPPRNWDEFYEAVKKLRKGDEYGFVYPSLGPVGDWCFAYFLFNNGGRIFNIDKEPDFANERNVEALDFLRKMKDEDLVPGGVGSYQTVDSEKIFFQGKAVMLFGSDWSIPLIQSQGEEFLDKVEYLPIMENKNGDKIVPGGYNGIMAYKQSKHPEQAKKFIKWWIENNGDLWTEGHSGFCPGTKLNASLPCITEGRLRKAFMDDYLPNMVNKTYPYKESFAEMANIEGEMLLSVALQRALTTDEDSKAILTDINEKIQEIMSGE